MDVADAVVDGDCDVFVVFSAVVAAAVIGSTWRQCCCVGGRFVYRFAICLRNVVSNLCVVDSFPPSP